MRSGNPTLRENTFDSYSGYGTNDVMTIQGTVNKTFILLLLVTVSAAFTWTQFFAGVNPTIYLVVGGIGSLIFALITSFVPKVSPITGPIYAILEGLVVGAVSAMFEAQYPGIALLAVSLTFSVLLGLLLIYKMGLIKVTQNFRLGVFAATLGVFLTYLLSFILGFFGIAIPFLHTAGPLGIIISLVIIVIAALNLVLDFDFIENGAQMNCPKYMEWYGAFGLMVTLIWLYFEILRLLYLIFGRRN